MHNTIFRRVLPVIAALLVLGSAGAQNQKLNMPRAQMSVLEAFNRINEQTGIGVAYRSNQIDSDRIVTFPSLTPTVDEVLKVITAGTDVAYSYQDKMILFSTAPPKPSVNKAPVTVDYVPSNPPAPQVTRPVVAPVAVQQKAAPPVVAVAPVSNWQDMGRYAANDGATPKFALKTNLLYGLGTLTPNLSLELGVGRKTTFEFAGSYNPWNLKGSLESNRKLVHMVLKPEFRYWLCEPFVGHFFGLHAIYSRYNIGTRNVPLLFDKAYRYDGHAVGGGITYGYNLALAKRWGVEFAIGMGLLQLSYDRFDCAACNRDPEPLKKTYFGPTNASVSLVFLIK